MARTTFEVQRLENLEQLREWCPPGTTVRLILRHVSASGMTRWIDPVVFVDGDERYIGYRAAKLLGWKYDRKHDGIKVEGAGMDMGFHLVYTLSSLLWRDTPEAEEYRRENERPSQSADAGYMLKHRWL